jgi:hypothetical protein
MHDQHDSFDEVDRMLEQLGQRAWRTPDLGQITTKGFIMNNTRRKMSRTNLAMLIGGLTVIGAGTAFGAAYAMGVFSGHLVTEDGQEFDVQMTETGNGVFEGTTSEGHQIKFITEGSPAQENIDLELTSPESGEFTFTVDPNDPNKAWTTTEEPEPAPDKE